ncbi:MAG TPA: cytochrome b N-terminal domain-containing protein [Dokdonella sp.]
MKASAIRRAWDWLEHALDRFFPGNSNPLRQLGAIACLMFAILLISGIWLYAVFDTSLAGAWQSIDALSREQRWPGGWLRSLHRYAADGFMLATLAHLLREWIMGHYSGFRAITWLTGMPLLVLMYVSGIGGFWLNWDTLGQYAAVGSAQLVDGLPLLGGTLGRNFLSAAAITDRLFSLLVFIHIGVPLLLLFGLWFHLQRITRPAILPPRPLLIGLLASFGAMALAWPVMSGAPADPDRVPTALAFDWIVLHLLPIADALSPGPTWILIAALLALVSLMPLRRVAPAAAVALVDADNCNGCRRCVEDCPYSAISLESHPDGRPGKQIAVVAADRCASCGICAGACPSATPFRSAVDLVNGIDMPQLPVDALRRSLVQVLQAATVPPIIVFGCRHGLDVEDLHEPDVSGRNLLCIGQLPPSFIEYALRAGAAGVVVSGCAAGACAFRLGNRWTAQRLLGEREPHLRASVPAHRYRFIMAGSRDRAMLVEAIGELRHSATTGIQP